MSELIPPLVSSTPPPILDDDDDEFDDFVTHNNYICDFPTKLEGENKSKTCVDINSNKNGVIKANIEMKALPNEVPIASKHEDVPLDIIAPSEKINGINDYREEPPEICSDDDDFGDFECSSAERDDRIEVNRDSINDKINDCRGDIKDSSSCNGFYGESSLSQEIILSKIETLSCDLDLSKDIDLGYSHKKNEQDCGGTSKVEVNSQADLKVEEDRLPSNKEQIFFEDVLSLNKSNVTCTENALKNNDEQNFSINDDDSISKSFDNNLSCYNNSNLKNVEGNLDDTLKFDQSIVTENNVESTINDLEESNEFYVENHEITDKNCLNIKENLEETGILSQHGNTSLNSISIENDFVKSNVNASSDSKIIDDCNCIKKHLFSHVENEENSILSEINVITNKTTSEVLDKSSKINDIFSERPQNIRKPSITNDDEVIKSLDETCSYSELHDSENTSIKPENLEDESFNFQTYSDLNTVISKPKIDQEVSSNLNNDNDFDNFADFESNSFNNQTIQEDDDFGDFVGPEERIFSLPETSNESLPQELLLNEGNAYDKSKIIIEDMFKSNDTQIEPYFGHGFTDDSNIFTAIKDVTETNALNYNWSKSNTQKTLLKALHIDSRNVLYGGGINVCMPKFASNLSSSPLEPIKFDVSVASTSSSQPSTSTKEIPSVVFDWNESGLANPLDSPQNGTVLLDLEQLVTSMHITSDNNENQSEVSLDEWESWLRTINKEDSPPELSSLEPSLEDTVPSNRASQMMSSDSISVNSLQLNPTIFEEENTTGENFGHLEEELKEETNNFNQILKPEVTVNIKLRETHIHEITVNDDDFTEFQGSNSDFDDFSDFKSCTENNLLRKPEKINIDNSIKLNEESLIKCNGFNINTNENFKQITETNLSPKNNLDKQPNENIPKLNFPEEPVMLNPSHKILQSNQSTLFKPDENIKDTKVSETILKPTLVVNTSNEQLGINWPDPGITDDELERLENYSRLNKKETSNEINKLPSMQEKRLTFTEKSIVIPANRVVLPSKEVIIPPNNKVVVSKDLVLPILESSPRKFNTNKRQDDDEWTDFISSNTERISTPELPLSIPQLKQIQPPKLPIPVITPMGLKQTKIPSTMPILQPKISHVPLQPKPPLDGYQPSIISHQYSMQMNQNVFLQNTYQTTTIPANIAHVSKSFNHDDEEWSDFMCSQPVSINPQSRPSMPRVEKVIPSISSMPDLNFASSNKYRHFNK